MKLDFLQKYHNDLIAGFIVFLIALPLSIGIALASGSPSSAGILSAIIGGIIGALITGNHVAINGPAAGMIVVISGSIMRLGDGDMNLGFKRTLAAIIIAGILQIILGILKCGKLALLCPKPVVHGMLAAIGVIIIFKQLPIFLGTSPASKSILGIMFESPKLIYNNDLPIMLTGLLCLAILIFWKSKKIPASVIVISVGIFMSYALDFEHHHDVNWLLHKFHIGPEFLVHVPTNIKELFTFPIFDMLFSVKGLTSTMIIFLIGTVESLLSSYAVDELDPQKRKTDFNKDIIGKGIANICCGLLGAYPIITEIVRSSANISQGAKTNMSNFFHGILMLLCVALIPNVLNHIPLTSLAAILILVGFNLAHPRHFKEVYHHGKVAFFLFMLTLTLTIVEDLLVGIFTGIIMSILIRWFNQRKANSL